MGQSGAKGAQQDVAVTRLAHLLDLTFYPAARTDMTDKKRTPEQSRRAVELNKAGRRRHGVPARGTQVQCDECGQIFDRTIAENAGFMMRTHTNTHGICGDCLT